MPSYEEDYENHRIDVPARFNPVVNILDRWADQHPNAEALVSIAEDGLRVDTQNVADLVLASKLMGNALLRLGLGKGDRILVMMPRVAAWYATILGAMRIGVVVIPTPNQLTARDILYRVRTAKPKAIVAGHAAAVRIESVRSKFDSALITIRSSGEKAPFSGWLDLDLLMQQAGTTGLDDDPTSSEDPLLIFFTSGTVSYPKMVLHRQSYALGHVGTARYWHDIRDGDRHWTISDSGWAKAVWGGLFGQWHEHAAVVQANLPKPDANSILSIIARHEVTSLCAPPTLFRLLVQEDLKAFDLSSLRQCTSAGEPLNPEVIRIWKEATGLTIRDGFGQTETTALVANTRNLPVRPGSMGRVMPGYVVDILDDSGRPLPPDVVGNIAVRSNPRPVGLFSEYLESPEQTSEVFRNGYYYTGDRGSRDADGYIWFVSRADDVITSSAYRIGPFEVESALLEHPAVQEAAVVGKDDEARTQIVCAFVVLAKKVEASDTLVRELQEHVKRETAPYKYPREIHFVSELPKTISGKIRRSELRQWLREGLPSRL